MAEQLDKERVQEDEQLAKLRAEVERIKQQQRADEEQDEAERKQLEGSSKEMDPAMRRYFAVCCESNHHSNTIIGTFTR